LHGVALLLVNGPKHDIQQHEHYEPTDSLPLLARERGLFQVGFPGARQLILRQKALAPQVEDDAEHHSHAGRLKAVAPTVKLPQRSADQGGNERPQIHSHVINGVGAIATRVALGIQAAHLRRQIRLKAAVPQNQDK
jgi:hypothetical protein